MTSVPDDGDMTNASRPDPFPYNSYEELPRPLRVALARQARASNALRVYRRRGWNPSAARHEYERARDEVQRVLDEVEFDEINPRLF